MGFSPPYEVNNPLLAPYEILAPLGVGGMGEFYPRETRLGCPQRTRFAPLRSQVNFGTFGAAGIGIS